MTNILEHVRERKSINKKKELSQSEQLFLDNIGHIEKIKNEKGYKMIRNYWVAEWNHSLAELTKLDINDLWNIAKQKAKLELATTFISYLDAHERGIS